MIVLEEQLFQYGIAGIFIAYLIYRDMAVNKEFIQTLKNLNNSFIAFQASMDDWRRRE